MIEEIDESNHFSWRLDCPVSEMKRPTSRILVRTSLNCYCWNVCVPLSFTFICLNLNPISNIMKWDLGHLRTHREVNKISDHTERLGDPCLSIMGGHSKKIPA
jgi:hypothetical protein